MSSYGRRIVYEIDVLAVGTPPSSLSGDIVDPNGFDARKSDSFRANTSKTKLESLLGEFYFQMVFWE